jgi:ADP-ribosyl-[dinitrogen reductase] hydrolase
MGDSWGHCLEFVPVQYEKTIIKALDETNFKAPGVLNRFRLKAGQYTDDSSMGLCLADSLLTNGHVDCLDLRKRFVMWWYLGYNNAFRHDAGNRKDNTRRGRSVGLGGQISYSLKSFIEDPKQIYPSGDENMSGNGSIMRLCPLPIFYRDSETEFMVSEAMKQSFTTHSGIQSAECAALLSYVIVAAIKSGVKCGKDFLDSLDFEPIMQYLVTDAVKSIANSVQNEVSF